MKILSVAVPCYNSEAYMRHAIESLLPGGEDVEILIVDDGSTDGTAGIADEYEAKYPGMVRTLHKENGGHGDAVMHGLRHATGMYFRVLDSDDWLDSEVLLAMIRLLRTLPKPVDLFITDFVYDKVGVARKHVMQYANALPVGRVFSWEEMHNLRVGQYILMHSATYRREMLLECGLSLPKHTFYVDNLYVYVPMRFVRHMYYMHDTLYHYYIGREDQSVHEDVMIRRLDQQMLVNRLMVDAVDVLSVPEPHCRRYLYSYLEIITAISSIMAILSRNPENLAKRDALWAYIQEKNPPLYRKLANALIGRIVRSRSGIGMALARFLYRFADKVVGFN
ncbi:MAG: glycosyltransferase family 2 protein [Clostridia bacterium]|nr:glycosyltransferase family 2 protein [Clostridia bacterium]